jgi:hypothetical protein
MIDEQSEKILAGLYSPFAEKLRQLTSSLDGHWRVDEGCRSFAEQDAYFEQGRSRPGALITRDRAGYSGHNYGTVAHLVPTVEGAVVRDNAAFLQLANEATNLGLQWGGNDVTGKFIEMSRVEMVILTMDECRALFKSGGLPAVWEAFDAALGIPGDVETPGKPTPEVAAELKAEEQAEADEAETAPGEEFRTLEESMAVTDEGKPAIKQSPVVARREKNKTKAKDKK